MNSNTVKKSETNDFIVQNVTLGPHFVSDIRLQFDPLGVIDLTWEDPRTIKSSNDLRKSLRMGILRKITRQEWEAMEDKKIAQEQAALLRQKKARKMQSVTDADGNERMAETVDPLKPLSKGEAVTVDGYANDSLSYATALNIAQAEAEAMGTSLSVEEFAQRAQANPNYVPNLLANRTMSISGDPRRGRAVVAMPGNDYGDGTTATAVDMTNFVNDGYIAGGENISYGNQMRSSIDVDLDGADEGGFAEEIDLLSESAEDAEPGSIKRK